MCVCVHVFVCILVGLLPFSILTQGQKCNSPQPCFNRVNEQSKTVTQVRWQHWIQNAKYMTVWKAVDYTFLL